MRGSLALVLCLSWLAPPAVADSPAKPESQATAKPAFEPTSSYAVRKMRGWTVRIHPQLLGKKKEVGEEVLSLLDVKLYDIVRAVPSRPLEKLQAIPIWAEFDDKGIACMCYHPSREWLSEHGYNPEKAGSIEIGNAGTFLTWTRVQPAMVLHELAHGYHHLVLGYDHSGLQAAFKRAEESKSYQSVLYYDGRMLRAYALNNDQEYFAELTEAWFGTNDFYPFVRPEVLKHDPKMAALLKSIWGE